MNPTLDRPSARDLELGRRLTAVTVGMDRFERRRSGGQGALDSEGLVPIYLGDDLVPPLTLSSWQEAEAELAELRSAASAYPEGARKVFLLAMITSLETAAALFQGRELSYRDKLERLVGVPAAPADAEVIAGLQQSLDRRLSAAGYRDGTLAERIRRWEAAEAIPSDDLLTVFGELMVEAKRRTDARVLDTGDYTMELEPVHDVPYTARCNFAEGKMDLNLDLRFSRPALKHLVAHEVFPGHSTQLLYTLERARAGDSPADVLLCTTNGATGAVQEGIGDQGVHLIDWIEDDDDAIHMELRRLRSAGQTTAAWELMAGDWDEARFRRYLDEEVAGQPAWIEGRLRFARHPFRGPFIASYWYGDEAVREVRERIGDDEREAFIGSLYGRMHTPASLRLFGRS